MAAPIGHNTGSLTFDDDAAAVVQAGVILSSLRYLIKAIYDEGLNRTELRLLAGIAGRMNSRTGTAFPHRRTLATEAGVKEKTVSNYLHNLSHRGYLDWQRRPNPERRRSTLGHFTFPLVSRPLKEVEAQILEAKTLAAEESAETARQAGQYLPDPTKTALPNGQYLPSDAKTALPAGRANGRKCPTLRAHKGTDTRYINVTRERDDLSRSRRGSEELYRENTNGHSHTNGEANNAREVRTWSKAEMNAALNADSALAAKQVLFKQGSLDWTVSSDFSAELRSEFALTPEQLKSVETAVKDKLPRCDDPLTIKLKVRLFASNRRLWDKHDQKSKKSYTDNTL